MNKAWQKNIWIPATYAAIQGITGMLQLFVFSKPPEAVFVVPTIVLSSFLLGIGVCLLTVYIVHVRKSRKLGSGTGDISPGRGESASSTLEGVGEDNWPTRRVWIDRLLLVMASCFFLVGITRLLESLNDVSSYKLPVLMMVIEMIIAGLWLSCSVLFFTAYVRRKRKPRSMEAPPRLARSHGQPKEARDDNITADMLIYSQGVAVG